ncbi:MAG: hypothetical protein H6953_09925 [Chromatiaceae bacterium]|nr:hypothetical protein [Gammaproteobacteria bacterium]MCP5305754.1 hypothetical protein [Chromatiaceae bacterium]MCP5312611.1 hypothetical protein [Chromatiaceae bacterium]
MAEFLAASAVIFAVLVGWLYVQDLYRRFAARHPQWGPFRSEATCQGSCGCHQGGCHNDPPQPTTSSVAIKSVRLEKLEYRETARWHKR